VLQLLAVGRTRPSRSFGVTIFGSWRTIWVGPIRRAMPLPWRQTARWSIPRRASSCTAAERSIVPDQALRDNRSAPARLLAAAGAKDPGCMPGSPMTRRTMSRPPYIARGARPAVAVLREQGVNSQTEMGSVFTRAGLTAYDVAHDRILAGRVRLGRFHGLPPAAGSLRDVWAPARAGQNPSCSIRWRATNSRRSSRATPRSRWACATAARCWRR